MKTNKKAFQMSVAFALLAVLVAVGAFAFFFANPKNANKTPGEIVAEKINAKIAECDRLAKNSTESDYCTAAYMIATADSANVSDDACPYLSGMTDRMRNSEFCYFAYAALLETNKGKYLPVSYCSDVQGAWAQESCLVAMAASNSDESYCSGTTNSSYRQYCIEMANAWA